MNKITINSLREFKSRKEKFSVLTAYDASFSALFEKCKIEVLLVGDSLGNVIQGKTTTVPVTMTDMIYHTRCVTAVNRYSLIIADMPYMSYATPEQTFDNATKLMQAGANMIKFEGGDWLLETVSMLKERGIPVCAHLGLTPQSVNALGGFKVQGKDEATAESLKANAENLQAAGADLLVLECVPASLGQAISTQLNIPTIGIGAGPDTDSQVLVLHDMLGISANKTPKFVKNFMDHAESIENAISNFKKEVKSGEFPSTEHCF